MRPTLLAQKAAIREIRSATGLSRPTAEKAVAAMAKVQDGCRAKVRSRDVDGFIAGIERYQTEARSSSTIKLQGRTKSRIRAGVLA